MADETTPTESTTSVETKTGSRKLPKLPKLPGDTKGIRTLTARVLWGVCVLFALILATAALLIALEANPGNGLVEWVIHRADNVDLGVFALDNPIKDFDQDEADVAKDVKTALFNYGLGAIVWLVLGRILDRIVRP